MHRRALLFTDIVNSTALVQRLGDAAASSLWAEHDRRARELLVRHNGLEIDRSDGFFLLFDDLADAAAYAVAYHDAGRELGLAARIGLHVGRVILRHNVGPDIARGAKPLEVEGMAKPLAARIMSLARGGQTLISETARDDLAVSLPHGLLIAGHGHYRFKGVNEPMAIFEVGRHDDPFTPPADSDKAYRVVPAEGLWLPVRAVRHNIPPERDAFVGRSNELRELAQRLDSGCRLLTLVGVGGTGKTRAVLRYGRAWLGEWPGGVYFCDLSEARSLEGIHFAVALALGVPLGKKNPTEQLGNAIAGRARCLVILDNFEQVVEHAAATLGCWLDRAAHAAFLVTSRERLHLQGETMLDLEPLPLASEALELFAIRARAQQASFVVDDDNRGAVARLVELLDGLPLAIELAAARIRILSPQQIVQRLKDRFQLLVGARGPAARQATLKAAIDWSWDLLQPWEQAAMAQCSVFDGGFTLEAAEAVLDLKRWPAAPPVMDLVQALVDKSLLRSWTRRGRARLDIEEPHFAMYLSIHEFAADKLHAGGGMADAHDAHGAYFAEFGSDAALESLGGVERRRALSYEIDNLVAACRRAVQRGDARIAVRAFRAAGLVLDLQGPVASGLALGAQVIAMEGMDDAHRAAASAMLGRLSFSAGSMRDAETWSIQAITLARGVEDGLRELSAMGQLALVFRHQGRVDEARALLEAALPRVRLLGNLRLLGQTLGNLGVLHYRQGRIEAALTCFEQGIDAYRPTGEKRGEAGILTNRGNLLQDVARLEEAAAGYAEASAIYAEMGDRVGAANCSLNLGTLFERQGRYPEARLQFEAALSSYREVGVREGEGVALGNLGLICRWQRDWASARSHFTAALAIEREVGHLRGQGYQLFNLGNLDCEVGRLVDGERHLGQAMAIFSQVGDRSLVAQAKRDLADVLLAMRRMDEAGARLDEAEAALSDVGDVLELALARCVRVRLLISQRDQERARALLSAVREAAESHGATPQSELGRAIAALRDALD